jgi:sn1-specific diacylglycerol lipase
LCAGLVLFNWVLFALTLFGLAVVFDPLGSAGFSEQESTLETLRHRKLTRLWMRRLQWTFCWMRRDKHGNDAFYHMASKYRQNLILYGESINEYKFLVE